VKGSTLETVSGTRAVHFPTLVCLKVLACILVTAALSAFGEDPQPDSPPMSPADSLAAIHVRDGYVVELVAAEPLVKDPVGIAWGTDGKLWVVEMADYPLGMDGNGKPGGRIRCLEDSNGDGQYDRSTVFLDGLSFPNGVMPWRNGLLVTAAPEVFYAEDTDNDGRADTREILFSGFQEGNQQLRINGLRWGLDNQVHCASGAHHAGYGKDHAVRAVKAGATIDLGSRDFRFDPDTGQLDPQSGPSQFGRNRDDWGNWFGEQNSHPLWHFVLQDHYLRRNPYFAPPDPRRQIVVPTNPLVYPAKTPQKRFHSFEQSGRFTSACSAIIYRDDLLFPQNPGNNVAHDVSNHERHAFTCEPFHNLVQHNIIKPDGVSFASHRDPAEAEIDFFASKDRWCRPVMVRTGPDGALWVVDMYRYMIEHPQWLTPEGREELKPFYRSGDDRGRIYRVVRERQQLRDIPNLSKVPTTELVAALDSPNGPQRDLIQQLLLWRADNSATASLETMAEQSENPLARLHALCTLEGLGKLSPKLVERAVDDDVAAVRRHAIRLAEPLAQHYPTLLASCVQRVDDQDDTVRLQLACSLGEWQGTDSARALSDLAMSERSNPYLAAAVTSSINQHNLSDLLAVVIADRSRPNSDRFLRQLLGLSVAFGDHSTLLRGLQAVVSHSPENEDAAWQFETVADVLDGLQKRGRSIAELAMKDSGRGRVVQQQIVSLTQRARAAAQDPSAPVPIRAAATGLWARDADTQANDINDFKLLLMPQSPPRLQVAIVRHLGTRTAPGVAQALLFGWPGHGPALRSEILSVLLTRKEWLGILLDNIESGHVARADIDVSTRQVLSVFPDKKMLARIKSVLADSGSADRREVVGQHQAVLAMTGNAVQGAIVFGKACASCHKLDGVGHEIGPNLRSITDRTPKSLLAAILDPSASVDGKYVTYIAVTDAGLTFTGMMTSETGNSVTLVAKEDKRHVILRLEIEALRSTGKSLMPDGVEKDLTHQDLADVIEYIRKPVTSKTD
jgi:putative membrane-bound dehydrogenase-like protein